MDKPADPATPFREVYQHFLAVLKKHGRKERARAPSTSRARFEMNWPQSLGPWGDLCIGVVNHEDRSCAAVQHVSGDAAKDDPRQARSTA